MVIVLMGYMASGKSLIGKLLAQKLKLEYYDLDKEIELKEEKSISKIFDENGEIYFRKVEAMVLKHIVTTYKNAIIAVGGGTPCYGTNLEIIKANSTSIYLNASIKTICKRLENEIEQRPLVKSIQKEDLPEFIAKHLFERQPFYQQATHTVIVNNKMPEVIVNEILELI